MNRRVEINNKLILLNSFSGIVSKILNILLLIWLNQFLIKNIPVEEYSIYPVAMSIMMFVMMLRSVLSGGLARHVTEAYAKGDNELVEELTSTGLFIQFVGFLVIIVFTAILVSNINKILIIQAEYLDEAKAIFTILILSFGIRQLFIPFEAGLQIKQRFVLMNLIELSGVLLRILTIFLFFNLSGIAILWVVVASELAQFYNSFLKVILSRRVVSEIKFKFSKINIKKMPELLSFSFWLFIVNFSSRIQSSMDPIFLNRFSDSFNVTCFHIGSLFKKQIQALQTSVVVTFVPALTSMHVENDFERIKRTFISFGKYYTWAYMLVALPVVIFRHDFINLYIGEEYATAASVMVLLLFDCLLVLGSTLTFYIAMAMDKVKKIALMMFISQIFNLCLTIYFVGFNRMGAMGSATATFITNFFISTVLIVPAGLKLTRSTMKEYLLNVMKPGFLPSFILVIPTLLLKKVISPESWGLLLLDASIFVLLYLSLIYFFIADKPEIDLIKKILSRKK